MLGLWLFTQPFFFILWLPSLNYWWRVAEFRVRINHATAQLPISSETNIVVLLIFPRLK